MATKVAINGFGRIGRLVARAILERTDHDLQPPGQHGGRRDEALHQAGDAEHDDQPQRDGLGHHHAHVHKAGRKRSILR